MSSMSDNSPCLESSWKKALSDEFTKPYMQNLRNFLRQEKQSKKYIYPKGEAIFRAFEFTPIDEVKVVILGQDPYHGPNQANGLCFSVSEGVPLPPSLQNIYQELRNDLNIPTPKHGCLNAWAKQGVLLLNAVLTVEKGLANSHQGKGWEMFTDKVIALLNERENVVFVLWGAYAQKKGQYIDPTKHLIIKSAHPSPLSAHRGFLGSKPFSKINAYLTSKGIEPIDWQLPMNLES